MRAERKLEKSEESRAKERGRGGADVSLVDQMSKGGEFAEVKDHYCT